MGGRKLEAGSFTEEENKLLVDNLDDEKIKEVEEASKNSVKIDGKTVTQENIKEFEK